MTSAERGTAAQRQRGKSRGFGNMAAVFDFSRIERGIQSRGKGIIGM